MSLGKRAVTAVDELKDITSNAVRKMQQELDQLESQTQQEMRERKTRPDWSDCLAQKH